MRSQGAGPVGFPGDSKGSTPTTPPRALGAQCVGGHVGAPPIRGGVMDYDVQRELDSLKAELREKVRDLDYRLDDMSREYGRQLADLRHQVAELHSRGDV